jgi:hypothetical protein
MRFEDLAACDDEVPCLSFSLGNQEGPCPSKSSALNERTGKTDGGKIGRRDEEQSLEQER